jgi:biopolymer transport protein ExbD
MAALSPEDDELQANINVTPLVDITLVLLIIFMVTATFIKDPVIPVELPRAANAEEARVKTYALVLDKKGRLYLDGKMTDELTLRQKLLAAYRRNKDIQAIVAADGAVAHKRVVRVIDIVRSTGITKFAINVRQEDLDQ